MALSPKYGAFTGETPAPMLKDFGLEWTLTGRCRDMRGRAVDT